MLRAGTDSILRREYPNGLIALCDPAERFASAAVSCSLVGGSRDESEANNGINHLLEHLLFKRTTTRSLAEIAEQIDLFGGDVNAYTDPESINLHGTVPVDQSFELLRFLGELICNATFQDSDLAIEKGIILQEIADLEDNPEEQTYQRFRGEFWKGAPLALPITGTRSSLQALTLDDARKHLDLLRVGKRIVVACSGAVDPEAFFEEVGQIFRHLPPGTPAKRMSPVTHCGICVEALPSQQSYLIIGKPFPGSADPAYLEAVIFSSLIGQGSSSVLFQALREREALCYDVDAAVEAYSDQSALLISCSSQSGEIIRSLKVMQEEIEQFFSGDRIARHLHIHRQMILSQLRMEDDSIRARQWRAVETELSVGRYIPAEEIVERMALITVDSLRAFAHERFFIPNSLLIVGGDTAECNEEIVRQTWRY